MDNVKMPGVIIIGRGNEEFALKKMGDGRVGVWDLNDKNNIMSILDFRTADKVFDTGMGAVGLYYDNPLNDWYGSFFDRVPIWMEKFDKPEFYWNTTVTQILKVSYTSMRCSMVIM